MAKLFKVGERIEGIPIVQIRKGTSNKVIIIGRQMKNHVYKVSEALKRENIYVEVLDDDYLKPLYDDGFKFIIDDEEWTVTSAWQDLQNAKWDPYRSSVDGLIKVEYLDRTPMFKINKMWIQKAQSEGVTIIDIGCPVGGDLSISGFYEMEKATVKWDK